MDIEDIYELSPSQQGLLFDGLLAQNRGLYTIQLRYGLRGNLEATTFARAWQQVAARHPALRTSFHWEDLEKPMQVVHREASLPLERRDWRALPEAERQQQLAAFRQADLQKKFDLTQAPLSRQALIRTAENDYQFIWTFHHLLFEGWSAAILFQEAFAFYHAFRKGEDLQLPQPRPYRDYIAWLQEQDFKKIEAYWRSELKGFTAPTPLGLGRSAESALTQYDELQIGFAAAETALLRNFAQQHQLTLNTLFQGVWALLLSRYSGEDDVLFGALVSGRSVPLAGVESMVGLFINVLPARVQVALEEKLLPWLKKLQARQAEARQHEFSPLAQIKRWSEIAPGRPLFESILIFENWFGDFASRGEGDHTLEVREVAGFQEGMGYPLAVVIEPRAELSMAMNYDRARFEAAAIQRMLGHFKTALLAIAANSDRRLQEVPVITAAEQRQLLDEWNDTAEIFPKEKCFHQLFEAQVERTPEAVALVFENEQLTYRELNHRANQLAQHLKKLGVGPEVMAGICVERSIEMVIGLLGILKAGGAYVPLDPAYPVDRIAGVLADAQVAVLLTTRATAENFNFSAGNFKIFFLDYHSGLGSGACELNPSLQVAPENLAYTIYTSGSTGKPKGVAVSHGALMNLLFSMRETPGLTAQDTVLAVTTLSFDIAGLELYLPLIAGARIVLASRETAADGKRLLTALADSGATVMQATPATWHMLIESDWTGGRNLKILCGGEAMPAELAKQLLARGAELWNMYGPTETTIWSTLARIEKRNGALTIGRPIANTQIYILDRALQIVPIGVHGALHIGGDGLARGYLNRPELTAEKFIPNPFVKHEASSVGPSPFALRPPPSARLYNTGDLARYLPDGKIDCLGRVDHQVKIRGFRIELGEIEAVCSQHPQIEQVVVTSAPLSAATPTTLKTVTPSGVEERRLVAYVVSRDKQPLPNSELRQFLMKKLPDYMIPSAFVFLDTLPLTPNGKVDRKALPAPDLSERERRDDFVAPDSPAEKILAGIWHQVLGVGKIGMHDNFFELGGHSLLATQVNSRLRKIFGFDFPLCALFEAPTIATLAQTITAQFGNNGKLEKIAQMLEKMSAMSVEEKQRLLERQRQKTGD